MTKKAIRRVGFWGEKYWLCGYCNSMIRRGHDNYCAVCGELITWR